MSQYLLDQTIALVRSKFTKREVVDVVEYGGEFSGAEIGKVSFAAPAIFISVLGWQPGASGTRLAGRRTRAYSLAAFILTKHADRKQRMRLAMNLSERLCLALGEWQPVQGDTPYTIASLEQDPSSENLYGRAVDKDGMALWLVRWTQDVQQNATPAQLFDLLRIEIEENYLPGVVPGETDPAPGGVVPTVTDGITFQQLTEEP